MQICGQAGRNLWNYHGGYLLSIEIREIDITNNIFKYPLQQDVASQWKFEFTSFEVIRSFLNCMDQAISFVTNLVTPDGYLLTTTEAFL